MRPTRYRTALAPFLVFIVLLTMAPGAFGQLFPCGGSGEPICFSDPVCDDWHQPAGPICTPCGGNNQPACIPEISNSSGCKPGLNMNGLGICSGSSCGGHNQPICNFWTGNPPCNDWAFPLGPICQGCGMQGAIPCPPDWSTTAGCMPGLGVGIDGTCKPCGGPGQPLCIDGCTEGLAPDPIIPPGPCTSCAVGLPGYNCLGDGRGQPGQPVWPSGTVENLRMLRSCDTGLSAANGICVNDDRKQSDVTSFTNSWTSRALKMQRELQLDMPITQCLFIGSHNSYNTSTDGFIGHEHSYSITDQLRMGIRYLMLDVFVENDDAKLCHGFCLPTSRPFRHAIEEIRQWLDENPDELLLIEIERAADESESAHIIEPLDYFLGDVIFTKADRDAMFDGKWINVTPRALLDAGFRVIVFGEGGTGSWHQNDEALVFPTASYPKFPGWSSDGINGVNGFYGLGVWQGAGYNGPHADKFDQFEGSTQVWWTHGIITPTVVRDMVASGVNLIGLAPIGDSLSGTLYWEEPFAPLMNAAVWSWAENEPASSVFPRVAKAKLTDGTLRFHPLTPAFFLPFALKNVVTGEWAVSATTGGFLQGPVAAAQHGPNWVFGVPRNGFEMSVLRHVMLSAGVSDVYVNYEDMNIDNIWVASASSAGPNAALPEPPPPPPSVLYVSPNGSDLNLGTSSGAAKKSIQNAINKAANKATIHLAPGTYFGQVTISAKDITIHGSTTGQSIIHAQGAQNAILVADAGNLTAHRLTITGANGDGIIGAGVRLALATKATLHRCTIHGNVGRAAVLNAGTLSMRHCTISGNTGVTAGALSTGSGGISQLLLSTITKNTSSFAPAISLGTDSSTGLVGCIVAGNTGLGTTQIPPIGPITATHCFSSGDPMLGPLQHNPVPGVLFPDAFSVTTSAGIAQHLVANAPDNIAVDQLTPFTVTYDLGGQYLRDLAGTDFNVYSSITALPQHWNLVTVRVSTNGADWLTLSPQAYEPLQDLTVVPAPYARSYDLAASGEDAVRFIQISKAVSAPSNHFTLDAIGLRYAQVPQSTPTHLPAADSPVVDSLDITLPALFNDQRGIALPQDGDGDGLAIADRGAVERSPFDAVPPSTCPADLDVDNQVGVSDLLVLLSCFGSASPQGQCAVSDFNGDSTVGVPDLLFLLGQWGSCP